MVPSHTIRRILFSETGVICFEHFYIQYIYTVYIYSIQYMYIQYIYTVYIVSKCLRQMSAPGPRKGWSRRLEQCGTFPFRECGVRMGWSNMAWRPPSFPWRTLPAPRRWARRIWAQLTLSQEALRFQSSYSCIAMANIEIMFNINYNIQEIYSKYIQ